MMNPLFAGLVCLIFIIPASSQTTTLPPPQQPLSQVREFLGLTDVQVSAILQNNSLYNRFSFEQQAQIRNAQAQIAVETAKDQLDPMALGTLYAGIESACRELRDKATSSQQQNISVLTDAQKAKLNMLSDAMKLIPTISEAQFGNLLESAGSPPYAFTTSSSFVSTPSGFSGVPGCASPFPGNIIPANRLATVEPTGTVRPGVAGLNTTPAAPANRIVNIWFDSTDFRRILPNTNAGK
jgi:hypothetical protein